MAAFRDTFQQAVLALWPTAESGELVLSTPEQSLS